MPAQSGRLFRRKPLQPHNANANAAVPLQKPEKPAAQIETLDPLVLSAKIMEPECRCGCCCDLNEVPEPLSCLFGDDIILDTGVKKLFVTLGQFSIIRLERDIQLLMPAYDICMPAKDCSCAGGCCKQEDPCEMFNRFEFPVEEFFPKDGRGAPNDFDKDCGCHPKKDECRGCRS